MASEFTAAFRERYEILRPLGEGGAARVYLARQRDLDRICAVKAFTPTYFDEEAAMARFLDEGRLLALVSHPNIVQVYDAGMDGGTPFLVLEYIEGSDLRKRLQEAVNRERRKRGLSPRETLEVSAGIARGLAAAHAKKVVHRDLKPENVLLDAEGTPRVADFGFAKVRSFRRSYATQQGMILGTPHYVAPEIVNQEEITPLSDLYSLGVMMYECLTGRVPYTAESDVAILVKHASEHFPPPSGRVPDLPRKVDDLVLWCTEKNPRRRPGSAAVLARELTEATEDYPGWVQRSSRRMQSGSSTSRAAPSPASRSAFAPRLETSSGIRPRAEDTRVLRRERLRLLGRTLLGLALVTVPLLAWFGLSPSVPEHVRVVRTFDGLVVSWQSRDAYVGRVSLRKLGTELWQDVTESGTTRQHRVRVPDLGEGEYQVAVAHPGGEVPCPPVTVRPFRSTRPRLVAGEGEDHFHLELTTTLAVQAAVTAGDLPRESDWSEAGTTHRLPIELGPDEEWRRPSLYLRDASGQLREPRIRFPLLGRRRMAERLSRELSRLEVDLRDFSNRVQAQRTELVEAGREEIRQIARELQSQDPSLNDRQALIGAEQAYLDALDGPFADLFIELPVHDLLLGFRSQARAWFEDPGVSPRERRQLYLELLSILPLDAVAEAEGGASPLALAEVLSPVVQTLHTPPSGLREGLAALEERIRNGQGVTVLDRPAVSEHTMCVRDAALVREHEGVFALTRALGHELVGFDIQDVADTVEAELVLPEESRERVKALSLTGYNLWPHFVLEVSLTPLEGGAPFHFMIRNRRDTFPGPVTHPLEPHDREQLITVRAAPWTLPPGRYRLELSGRLIPGTWNGLYYQLPKLLVTWD